MPGSSTRAWRPDGPRTRPFRFGQDRAPDSDPPLSVGTLLGDRYRVLGLLGEGGMGRVYAAEHVYLHRQVAVKLLRRDRRADEEAAARFEQEARAASRIGHETIVEMVDFVRTPDGTLFLAMELLRGESLEDWMSTPGRLVEALPWLVAVARGLHAAHAAGVVHRDVKPANIFLHRDGDRVRPKILDFGIAKLTHAEQGSVETQAGTVLGTPYYLAPERALGRPLDPRADLYSLGIILYELLTGTVPFVDDTFMAILGLHIKAMPLDPRQATPERSIPDGLARLTMRLLAKDPRERPPSGEAVAAELEGLLVAERDAIEQVRTGPRTPSETGSTTRVLELADVPSTPTLDVRDRPTTVPADVHERPTTIPMAERRGTAIGYGASQLASAVDGERSRAGATVVCDSRLDDSTVPGEFSVRSRSLTSKWVLGSFSALLVLGGVAWAGFAATAREGGDVAGSQRPDSIPEPPEPTPRLAIPPSAEPAELERSAGPMRAAGREEPSTTALAQPPDGAKGAPTAATDGPTDAAREGESARVSHPKSRRTKTPKAAVETKSESTNPAAPNLPALKDVDDVYPE